MGLENFNFFSFDIPSIQMTILPSANSPGIPTGTSSTGGAAAVLMRPGGQTKVLRCHLGELARHTAYECELVGLLLATELIHRNPSAPELYHIFLDNQAAINASTNVTLRSGQHLAQAIFRALHKPQRSALGRFS